MDSTLDDLTDRQRREQEFHRDFAARHAALVTEPVSMDVVEDTDRRWWNAYWSLYDRILSSGLAGKRVLIPGCGFGTDAIRIARLGAAVAAFDISPEIIEIARQRGRHHGLPDIEFGVMTAETLLYPDDHFDAVVFVDILHHVDIGRTMQEVRRVLKPGGLVIGNELYTHSRLQALRETGFVARQLYPRMRRWIYGTDTPYITADEHKINEAEFRLVSDSLTGSDIDYFGCFEGRLFPNRIAWASRLDRRFMRAAAPIAATLGSRVVFRGRIRKAAAHPA